VIGVEAMNLDHVKAKIIYQCNAREGFLAKLRVLNKFDEGAYRELVAAIKAYRDAVIDQDLIDRKVAGSLYRLVYTLLIMLEGLPADEKLSQMVQDAHAECWELAEETLTPPEGI
jgi:hypothetical protein